jgi:hypothetical protein
MALSSRTTWIGAVTAEGPLETAVEVPVQFLGLRGGGGVAVPVVQGGAGLLGPLLPLGRRQERVREAGEVGARGQALRCCDLRQAVTGRLGDAHVGIGHAGRR